MERQLVSLFEVRRGSYIELPQESTPQIAPASLPPPLQLHFHNIDGMYSRSSTREGNDVHLAAWTEVYVIEKPTDWPE